MSKQRPGKVSLLIFPVVFLLVVVSTSCDDDKSEAHGSWQPDIKYPFPSDSILGLWAEPYIYPFQECRPVPSALDIAEDSITLNDAGESELCVWQNAQGCAPEGLLFQDYGSCDLAVTTSARFFKFPGYKFESDEKLLEDEEYQRESDWVRDQARSCGCICCHDAEAGIESGFATAFDISAPGVWTDTMSDFGLLTAAGDVDTTLLGGSFDPATNHNFNRALGIFPTTDRPRMTAFFRAEIERRGLTPEELQDEKDSQEFRFAAIYKNYTEETQPCGPGSGIDPDGRIYWSGDRGARYIFVMEADAGNIGDPPGLDKPEGILWRMDTEREAEPFPSGTVTYGAAPEGAFVRVPGSEIPEPILQDGVTYKLVVLSDFGPYRLENCHFVMGDPI